jgi:hypothetical protein
MPMRISTTTMPLIVKFPQATSKWVVIGFGVPPSYSLDEASNDQNSWSTNLCGLKTTQLCPSNVWCMGNLNILILIRLILLCIQLAMMTIKIIYKVHKLCVQSMSMYTSNTDWTTIAPLEYNRENNLNSNSNNLVGLKNKLFKLKHNFTMWNIENNGPCFYYFICSS